METIYLLVAAECGWWGLGTLLLWFLYYYFSDIISMFVLRKKPCAGFVIGVFGGLTCNYWHSTLEWSLKQNNNFAGLIILYALIGVIAVHRKSIVAAYRHSLAQDKPKTVAAGVVGTPPASLPKPPSADRIPLPDTRDGSLSASKQIIIPESSDLRKATPEKA